MAELDYLVIPVSGEIQAEYSNSGLFNESGLIIRYLPDSYRIIDNGIDYQFFEGIQSTTVMVERNNYQFSISTFSTSNTLGLVLQGLIDESLAIPGEIQPITVIDDDAIRNCTMKFRANSGTATLVSGQKVRSAGYLIEFRQLS